LNAVLQLYNDIKDNSYVRNNNHDDIAITVGRNGELIHYDGRHRLAIAKLVGIQEVPVRIVARHLQWLKFKNEILQFAREHEGKVYAPLLHPDLEWIPSFYGHKRFEMIQRAVRAKPGALLDIGCNWGYFCHRFEKLGFDCVGVEEDAHCAYFLRKLRAACGRSFQIVHRSIFDYVGRENPAHFQVVLALAIFHHFIKTRQGCERLREMLRCLNTVEMYFLPHLRDETQMQNAYWNPSEDEFVSFVSESARLPNIECLGSIEDGRTLFRLS
ncbi:MAG: hypothetical protein L0215_17610, partial [Gemmataceae bacterium]|nr:hypothetical protein [Gemmataceae bacterium]